MAIPAVKVDETKMLRGVLSVKGNTKVPTPTQRKMWKQVEQGHSIADVAKANDVTPETVKIAVRRVEKFLTGQVALELAPFKLQMNLRLDIMRDEAMKAWNASKGRVIKRRKIKYTTDPEDPNRRVKGEEEVTEERSPGDPRFLLAAAKFMAEQRQMWPGANAPKAQALTNADGTAGATLDVSVLVANLTPEEREHVKFLAQQARQKMLETTTT